MHFSARRRSAREVGGWTGEIGCTRAQVRRSLRPRRLAANVIQSLSKPRGPMSLSDSINNGERRNGGLDQDAMAGRRGGIKVRQISIGGQSLRVAIRHGTDSRPPLLLFNGIGANWELAKPFL